MGEKAAMACTVAVEEVITEHYNDQLRTLNEAGYEEEAKLRAVSNVDCCFFKVQFLCVCQDDKAAS